MGGKERRGTNALEVIIALAIVSLGLLGVASVYTFGTAASRDSEQLVGAIEAGERLVTLIRTQNKPYETGFPPAWLKLKAGLAQEEPVALNSPPFAHDFPADTPYLRQIVMEPLGPNMVELKVRVGWLREGRQHWIELVSIHAKP